MHVLCTLYVRCICAQHSLKPSCGKPSSLGPMQRRCRLLQLVASRWVRRPWCCFPSHPSANPKMLELTQVTGRINVRVRRRGRVVSVSAYCACQRRHGPMDCCQLVWLLACFFIRTLGFVHCLSWPSASATFFDCLSWLGHFLTSFPVHTL